MHSPYDFIIVGGGSAGCVLASRLTEDRSTRVLVLEAGRPDYRFDVFIHMPAALSFPIGSKFYDWKYESEPEPYMNGRRIYHARGKVLGGSSSINGMIFQRGNPLDYERWAADPGLADWSYAHCLPYFKKMETGVGNADELGALDIPVVHDLPGVGENMQDHLEVYIQHRATQPVSMAPMLAMWRRPIIGMQWLARRGPGATNHFEGGGFARSNDE